MRRQVALSCWRICIASVFALGIESALAGDNSAPAASRESRIKFVIKGQILAIDDGDTLRMQNARGRRFRIRLSDLDAPEVGHKKNPYARVEQGRRCPRAPARAPGQAGGQAAAQTLRALVASSPPARAECYEKDNFGRSVCHVFAGGINLNLEQLRTGQAMLAQQTRWIRDGRSKAAEQKARTQRLGIWAQARPLTPSRWRTRCWCEGNCAGSAAEAGKP